MMKSFFKKLSLVMALAMVVSLVAPAGSAFAAEAGIALQGKKTTVEAIDVEVGGDVVDLCFLGAPADWKSTFKWTPGDETIASVDKAGKVTGLKAGETTVTITAGADGSYKHTVKVTVTEPVDVNAFEAKQKSHITFDVNFNKEVSYSKAEDVYLYRVFDTEDGDVYAVWAVRKATLSADKKTLTVEPYVQFGDGERYLVAFQDIENQLNKGDDLKGINYDEFTTYIGEIDNVKISWTSYDEDGVKLADKKAYTNGEDAEYDVEVKLSAQLYSGDVNLTEIYKNDGYLEYTLINEDAIADYAVLSDDTLVFTKSGIPATVKAVYTFEKADGEEGKAESPVETIVSEMLDPLTIEYVEKWSFVDKDGKVDWSKVDHDVRAGKTAKIALLVKDNRGGQWETTDVANNDKIPQFGTGDTEGMTLHFYSTDNDHFLISDVENSYLGEVETYIKMKKAVVYVALHDEKLLEEYDTDFVGNIGACVMNITDPAELDDAVVYATDGKTVKTSVTLVTNAVTDPLNTDRFVKEFTTASFIVKLLDQDDAVYNYTTDPVLTDTTVEFKMSTTNKDLREDFEATGTGVEGLQIIDNGDGTASLDVDAVALNDATTSSTITVTITATQYDEEGEKIDSAKTTFKVYLRDPELYDDEDTDLAGWNIGDVKTTSWGLSTANAGLMPKNGGSATDVLLTMLSKSYAVGYYNRYDMAEGTAFGEAIKIATTEEEYSFKKGTDFALEEGIYVLVTGPDGVVAQTATPGALGVEVKTTLTDKENSAVVVNVTGDSDGDNIVEYLKTGKYTVKVTFVTDVKTTVNSDGDTVVDTITYKTRNSSFSVTNDIDTVSFVGMKEVTTPLELDPENVSMDTVKDIIQANYLFKYDKKNDGKLVDWVPSDAEIDDVQYIVRGGYITIKSITFKIASGENFYVTTTRDINRAVKLGVEK